MGNLVRRFEAVYRSTVPKPRVREALSYLDQAEDYFNAGTQVGGPLKPDDRVGAVVIVVRFTRTRRICGVAIGG